MAEGASARKIGLAAAFLALTTGTNAALAVPGAGTGDVPARAFCSEPGPGVQGVCRKTLTTAFTAHPELDGETWDGWRRGALSRFDRELHRTPSAQELRAFLERLDKLAAVAPSRCGSVPS
jgi:hypothetical protein